MLNVKIGYVSENHTLGVVAEDIFKSAIVSVDVETTGLDALSKKVRLLQIATSEACWVLDMFKLSGRAVAEKIIRPLATNERIVKVMQNGKFDMKFMFTNFGIGMREWKSVFDTYLAAKLLAGGLHDGCGLDDLAARLLGIHLDKSFQKFDWSGPLFKEPLAYAGIDAAVLLPLYRILSRSLVENQLQRVAQIEFECSPAIGQLELNGITIDKDLWLGFAEKGKEELYVLEEHLRPYFGDINLDSNQQLYKALSAMTGQNITSVKHDVLEKLIMDYYESPDLFGNVNDYRVPIIRLMEYKKKAKLQDSFGPDFMKYLHKKTGRVHPEYTQIETNTARNSCLAGWSPVTTPYGTKPLHFMYPGDMVWTHKERWRPVQSFMHQGIKPVYDVILCTGDQLTCTLDHRLLCSDGEWRELQEIANALFESVGCEQREPDGSVTEIQRFIPASDHGSSEGDGNLIPQRMQGTSDLPAGSGAQSHEGDPSFHGETWKQEPDVRQEPRPAPQLEGRLRRWVRVLNSYLEGWQAALRPSHSPDGTSGSGELAGGDDRSPYRQRPQEQFDRQPGSGHEQRPPDYSLYAGEGQPFRSIKEVNYRGSIEVYDISVEEDESFEVLGVFVHNCRNPNLQQIPREEGLRSAFIPTPGNKMWVADYSQIELRIMAQLSKDEGYTTAFEQGIDQHRATATGIFHVTLEQVTTEQRQAGKVVNFAVPYGAGAPRYALALNVSIEEARRDLKAFYDAHPGLVQWHRDQFAYFKQFNCVRSTSGRYRALPHWRYDEYMAQQAAKNFPIQSSSADITKLAMVRCFQELPEDVLLVHVVHDELVHEIPEKDVAEIGPEIDRIMIESAQEFVPDIPIIVDSKQADSWSKG